MDNLLKLPVLPLPCKLSNLSVKNFFLVHTVPRQSQIYLSVCSIRYVNYLVRMFELFIHVFRHLRYQHWGKVFLSNKILCCNDQLIPHSNRMVGICLSHCKMLHQWELFVVAFLEVFEFYIELFRIILLPRRLSKFVLAFAKVNMVGKSQLV